MTASITIVNTSNYDGENIKVTVGGQECLLKPTQHWKFNCHPSVALEAVRVEAEGGSAPKVEDGVRKIPVVESRWENG